MKNGFVWAMFSLTALWLAGSSQAGFTISLQQDAIITPNGTATMDVYIEGAGHQLGTFQYTFQITAPDNLGILQFRSDQPNPNAYAGLAGEAYVFYNDSDWISGFPQDPIRSKVSGSDTLQIGDPIEFDDNSRYLLARLEFEHFGEVTTDGFFTISLVADESSFDSDFDPDNNNYVPFGISSAQLKIVATPEPATLGMLALMGIAGAGFCRRKMRV